MKRSSHGFTLIEVLLAIALLSTLLTMVAMALGGLARADRRTRNRIDQQRSVHRLVMQLRKDVHGAESCTISDVENPPAIVLPQPDLATANRAAFTSPKPSQTINLASDDGRTIRFQANNHGFVRTVSQEGTDQHRDFYKLGSSASATWTMDTSQGLPMVVLTLAIPNSPDRAAARYVIRTTLINHQPDTE